MNEDEPEPAQPEEVVELPIDGTLDLHTFRPQDVKVVLTEYLEECRRKNIFTVRVVHGKGQGTLRRTVHALLEKNSGVASFAQASEAYGGWGATFVELKPTPNS